MRFDVLTIFPEIIDSYINESILKRGQRSGKIKVVAHDFRQFATDKHRKVDDSPYGGGPGMILKVEPIYKCLKSLRLVRIGQKREIRDKRYEIVILDPAGKKFNQKMAQRFAKLDRLILICGRYEGFDERVYKFADEKVSIGDYVLAGGELPALVVLEAVARLVPGVVGNPESLEEETFGHETCNIKHITCNKKSKTLPKTSLLHVTCYMKEYPQYTRPANFMGLKVPEVLLSGNHQKIEEWRRRKAVKL